MKSSKEQEEAIETMKHWIDYEKENRNKINKADKLIGIQETILNMLKEKDKEIETLKRDFKIVDQECSRLERKEAKQDKIIDLMAEFIFQNVDVEEDICNSAYVGCKQETAQDITCINCIKQYFERKSEKWKLK